MSEQPKTFFSFLFFQMDPKWRWMADLAKDESAKEAENILKNSKISYKSYSTLGLRDDAEFLLWFKSESVEKIQDTVSKLYLTVFGKYVILRRAYLSCTRPSVYTKNPTTRGWYEGEKQKKYAIVFPFIKTREWYLLSLEKRKEMMAEHIVIGQKHREVTLNTTYSFGIHDQDFMLAHETDDLGKFQELIMELRETRVSEYIKVDTPMTVCVKNDIIPLIRSLG